MTSSPTTMDMDLTQSTHGSSSSVVPSLPRFGGRIIATVTGAEDGRPHSVSGANDEYNRRGFTYSVTRGSSSRGEPVSYTHLTLPTNREV